MKGACCKRAFPEDLKTFWPGVFDTGCGQDGTGSRALKAPTGSPLRPEMTANTRAAPARRMADQDARQRHVKVQAAMSPPEIRKR